MMKLLRPFFSILIAALLLVASTGFSVSKHYCKGNLASSQIVFKETTCCKSSSGCHVKHDIQEEDTGCCQLETDYVLGIDVLNFFNNDLGYESSLAAASYFLANTFELKQAVSKGFTALSPPPLLYHLLGKTRLNFIQRYLI